MVNKRINKKGALSFTVIFLAMLIGFVIFNGAMNFLLLGPIKYGTPFDSKYNDTFTELQESQTKLDHTITNVTDSVKEIEVQQGVLQTFWNSFKGLGAILKIPIALIDVGYDSATAIISSTTILPPWAQGLLLLLVLVIIGLSIVAAMTGGNTNV